VVGRSGEYADAARWFSHRFHARCTILFKGSDPLIAVVQGL